MLYTLASVRIEIKSDWLLYPFYYKFASRTKIKDIEFLYLRFFSP